jgi:aminoglycoside phosphotransferase (APT) family kinase protein
MMFSEDESSVTLLDYQLMGLLHPAKDLWYFLAATTDAEFRRAHLQGLVRNRGYASSFS